jgi:hypothetical protein
MATDNGSPRRKAYFDIHIGLSDVNDKPTAEFSIIFCTYMYVKMLSEKNVYASFVMSIVISLDTIA